MLYFLLKDKPYCLQTQSPDMKCIPIEKNSTTLWHGTKWWPHAPITVFTRYSKNTSIHLTLHSTSCYAFVSQLIQSLLCQQASASPFFMISRTHLPSILLTQPWLTRSWREMSQGRTPWWANSTILCLTTSGKGRPFTNTPPSWFTPPCPADTDSNMRNIANLTCLPLMQ